MFYKNQDLQELWQDLKTFGLNPKEWNLVQETGSRYKIQSEDDDSFVFIGSAQIQNQKKRWKKIEILSL